MLSFSFSINSFKNIYFACLGDWIPKYLFPNRGMILAIYFTLICILKWKSPSPFYLQGFIWIVMGWIIRLWASFSISPHSNSSTIEAPQLAYRGIYSYIRHPLYLGNILIGIGTYWVAFAHWNYYPILLLFFLHHILLILSENFYLSQSLGSTYIAYKKQTPFWFFPYYNFKYSLVRNEKNTHSDLSFKPLKQLLFNQGSHFLKTLLSLGVLLWLSSEISH